MQTAQQRLFLSLIVSTLALSTSLSACAPSLITQPPVQQVETTRPVLGSALQKRPLLLQRIGGQVVPVAGVTAASESGFSIMQVSAGMAAPDIAISRPAIAPAYYYGGHDFNQYMIQFAEESLHKAASGNTLLQVYNQDVKGLLSEWDASARLIESRAQINGSEEEWIHLPGRDGEPLKLQPLYVFRFASTPKKETLNIYVLKDEIRVHRMVWGEPSIQINQVKIDSDQAVSIAQKAFADRSAKPGYPVYPETQEANMQVIYDVPKDLKWHVQLNQQDRNQIRYFLHFSFQQMVDGQQVPMPVPMPEPLIMEDTNQSTVESKPMPPTTNYMQHFYGSIEIDAISGAVKSMNRPVWYKSYPERPMPTEPSIGDSGGSSAGSTGSADASVSSPIQAQ